MCSSWLSIFQLCTLKFNSSICLTDMKGCVLPLLNQYVKRIHRLWNVIKTRELTKSHIFKTIDVFFNRYECDDCRELAGIYPSYPTIQEPRTSGGFPPCCSEWLCNRIDRPWWGLLQVQCRVYPYRLGNYRFRSCSNTAQAQCGRGCGDPTVLGRWGLNTSCIFTRSSLAKPEAYLLLLAIPDCSSS